MKKTFYTLWKGNDDGSKNAILLDDEKVYYTKKKVFKRAQQLADGLAKGWNYVILVRKITVGSLLCDEWEFKSE